VACCFHADNAQATETRYFVPTDDDIYHSTKLMQSNPTSSPQILQLWFSRLSDSTIEIEQSIQKLFSPSETKRLESIKSDNRRREYLLSRALMRHALSQKFHLHEKDWLFIEQPESAPVIHNLPENTYFSLSHSRGLICFAISGCPMGIDIEASSKRRDFPALATMFMNKEELDYLIRNESTEIDYFYRVWCAKEAYYKSLPPSEQSTTSLRNFCFSDLTESDNDWHLIESKIEQYRFAAMIKNKPDRINCSYFLSTDKCLDGFGRFEIH
jgi:4'-phosphopantetheinyl transferase